MKKLILMFLLIISCTAFSQISRVVRSKIIPGPFGTNGLFENNQLHQYALDQNTDHPDSTVLENIVYDELGNVLEINYDIIPENYSENIKIVGVFSSSPQIHLIHVVKRSSVTAMYAQHVIIEYNTVTNTIVQRTTLNLGNLLRHTGPSKWINGSIVTYIIEENVGLLRIAISPSNLSSISQELVDAQASSNGSVLPMSIGFTKNGNYEYVSCSASAKVYKRITSNNFISSQVNFPSWVVTSNTSIAALAQKEVLIYANRYYVLDENLNAISSGLLLPNLSTTGNLQIAAKDNKFYVLEQVNRTKLFTYDSNFQAVDVIEFNGEFENSLLISNNNQLSFFSSWQEDLFNVLNEDGSILSTLFTAGSGHTVAFNHSTLGTEIDFQDLGVNLKTDNTNFLAQGAFNICGYSNSSTYEGGIHFVDGNTENIMLYGGANNLLAKNASNQAVGAWGIYYNYFFQYGPMTNAQDYDWKLQAKYTRGYYVTKKMIQNHIDSLNFGSANYIPQHGIREWPAHGDVSIGQAANVASFVDLNGNGNYEPMLGEYPKIYGDECYLGIGHMSTGTPSSAEVELHSYRYTYACDTNTILHKTYFQKNQYILRGMNLDSVYSGLHVDFDIGNPTDDYCGTDVTLGLIYAYNGDAFDEVDATYGGFQDTIPAFGVLTLQGVKQNSDGLDNPVGPGPNQSVNGIGYGDGILDNEYIGLSSSHWYTWSLVYPEAYPNFDELDDAHKHAKGWYSDGSRQTLNSGGIPYNHAFFGNSDPTFYSSQGVDHGNNNAEEISGNLPAERYMNGFSGPTSATIGDTISTQHAFLYAVDSANVSPLNSVALLRQDAATLKAFFAANDAGCGNTFGTIQENLETIETTKDIFKIYPNPTIDKCLITGLEGPSEIVLLDMNGAVLNRFSTSQAYLEVDLSQFAKGLYFVQIQSSNGKGLEKVTKF